MKNFITIIFTAIVLALVGLAIWRVVYNKDVPPAHHSIILDQSDSKINGCGCIREYARQQFIKPHQKGEMLFFYVLGTPERGFQPRLVWSHEIPKDDRTMTDPETLKKQFDVLLNDLDSQCQAVPKITNTPLYEGVKRVIQQMQVHCKPGSNCTLYAQTDLEETVEPNLIQAFKTENRVGKSSSEIKQIENNGIQITFAGVSEIVIDTDNDKIKGKTNTKLGNGEVWQTLWRRVFTDSDRVAFEPMCSSAENGLQTN